MDGIGVVVLMDTSGSMDEPVRDAAGARRAKIEIARESVRKLIAQTAQFAQNNPDKKVLIGIYEFSNRGNGPGTRRLVRLAPPDINGSLVAIAQMKPSGGTPIGDAIMEAKRDLDRARLSHQHILVVTDGENNQGYAPQDVVDAISRLPEEDRASTYFVAFDIAAEKFKPVRDAGGMVFAAADEQELQQTLDYVLTGKILAEQPVQPK